jgi:hypothetical protein
VLHGGGQAAGRERRGERCPVVVAPGSWLVARREVQSTGGTHGDIGGAVPWPEVPVCVEALLSGNDGAGWLAASFEQRTTVQGERGDNTIFTESGLYCSHHCINTVDVL